MSRRIATILGIIGVLSASSAAAGPPALRPIDVETVYALSEGALRVGDRLEDPRPSTLTVRTIVLDPGHGGSNTGATGVAEVFEKGLTLALAYAVRAELGRRHPGVNVLLTRYWDRDVELDERIQWANAMRADLFVSLHYNAATHDRAIGYETYHLTDDIMDETTERGSRRKQKGSKTQKQAWRRVDAARVASHRAARAVLGPAHERSKHFAAHVQAELVANLESTNRGVKAANFAVLRGAMMPAVVVESGFLTHPSEGIVVLGAAHQQKVVKALADAIEKFDQSFPLASPPSSVADAGHSGDEQQ